MLTIALAIIVGLLSFAFPENTYAAADKPARVPWVRATASGQTVIYVEWGTVRGADGYLICRDGKKTKRTSPNAKSFKQKGLYPGKRYGFTVRAFKIYKQKQWYNKKTKKWQLSKPKKSVRGKSRKVNAYIYSNPSPARYATTSTYQAPVSNFNYSWDQYQDQKGDYWGLDLSWKKPAEAVKFYIYNKDGKRIASTSGNLVYGIKVNDKATIVFHITAVSPAGKESTRKSLIVHPRVAADPNTSGSPETEGSDNSGNDSGQSTDSTGSTAESSNTVPVKPKPKHIHADVVSVTDVAMVIIGASRAYQLYKSGYRNYSYVAVSGGKFCTGLKGNCKTVQSKEYRTWDKKVPYAKSRHKAVIDSIDRSLKKSHANKTILIAPTNDIAGNPTDTQVRVRALAFAKYAKTTKRSVNETRTVQVSGKSVNKTYTYKNAVYVVSCTPTLGGVHANLHDTNIYNLELKKLAKTYGYTYVQLRDAKKNEFMNDGIHFKGGMTGYNKYMIQTFLKLKY